MPSHRIHHEVLEDLLAQKLADLVLEITLDVRDVLRGDRASSAGRERGKVFVRSRDWKEVLRSP